jgi:hypothetical protein
LVLRKPGAQPELSEFGLATQHANRPNPLYDQSE